MVIIAAPMMWFASRSRHALDLAGTFNHRCPKPAASITHSARSPPSGP